MSKFSAAVLTGILASGIIGLAAAQANSPRPPAARSATARGSDDSARQLAHLTRKLKLSPEQQGAISGILDDRQAQLQSLHQDPNLSREDMMSKANAILDDSKRRIEALLNDSQRRKFEKDQRTARSQHRGDQGNSFQDGGENPPPPPDDMGPPPDGPPPDGGGPGGPPGA